LFSNIQGFDVETLVDEIEKAKKELEDAEEEDD
jgi:hypothetical protein